MIIPYDYQSIAADKAVESLQGKGKQIVMAPTGSGKSIVLSEVCQRLPNDPILILQPSKEILEQNFSKLEMYGIGGMTKYSASVGKKDIGQYTYATVGSIKDFSLFKRFRYILVDECDMVGEDNEGLYKKFLKEMKKATVVGLTATPFRHYQRFYTEKNDKGDVINSYYTSTLKVMTTAKGAFFNRGFCFKITNKTMFEKGFLVPVEYRDRSNMEFSGIRLNSTGGDWRDDEMDYFLTLPENVRKVAEAIVAEDPGLPNNLVFCRSIQHANNVAEAVAKMGLDCEVIWGNDPDRDRKIRDFREGRIKRMINAKVLGVGFDFPGLSCVTLGFPTMSLRNMYQWCGRSVRKDPNNPNKVAKIIDTCNNIRRLGRIETIRITQNPFTKKDQVETDRGVISDRPLFTFKVTSENYKKLAS